MNLDERWVYRFIRTDLPAKQHMIQAGHASFLCGLACGREIAQSTGIAFLIDVGMPNIESLMRVVRKLDTAGIKYVLHTDTDVSPDPSALCTFPVDATQRNKYFHNYRLYSAVAQSPQEHLVSNEEVGSRQLPSGANCS